MPSETDFSNYAYDARPEAGRVKQHLESDESDNERPSGPKRRPSFLNDDEEDELLDDDDDEENRQHDRSSPSASTGTVVNNPFRQATAFPTATTTRVAPNSTTTSSSSSGPKFHYYYKYKEDRTKLETPIHTTLSEDGRSMFCVEGYVNTPELSAGRGGGLNQGLSADGPYKSLFRARSRSESRAGASANKHHKTSNAVVAPALHVLAEVAQSPEALSPISSTASPKPRLTPPAVPVPAHTHTPAPTSDVPTPKKRSRKSSPLITSTSLEPIFATRSSPFTSTTPKKSDDGTAGSSSSSTSGEGKQRETLSPEGTGSWNGKGSSEQRYERGLLQPSVQGRPRKIQKNENGHGNRVSLKEVGPPFPRAPPASADHLSYDYIEGDYLPSYPDAGPSCASNTAYKAGQSLSPPRAIARTATSKESSLAPMADKRSVMPGTNSRMITLLIEDRRHGTDELAEVHVPLNTVSEGHHWADAKDICVALQNGPSRIDGPARVFAMRGKYRQTFLRIFADGEEMTQSANLKVETDRTLPVVVEGIPGHVVMAAPFPSPNPIAPVMNTVHPLTPVSDHLGIDGIQRTSSDMGPWPGGSRKRKRETNVGQVQQSRSSSPEGRSLNEEYYDRPWKSRRNNPISFSDSGGYMSDSPPVAQEVQQRREQTHFLDRPGPSSACKMSLQLQPPPAPMEDPQRMHDKVVSFLQDKFMEDAADWNKFSRDRAHVGSLGNIDLLNIYWFAQERLETWVGSRLPKDSNNMKVEIGHVLDALGVTEDWYRECNETLSLVIAYGEPGERWKSPRAVAACRDHRAPRPKSCHSSAGGPTSLILLLREVHEEYCERVRGRNGQGRASSSAEST